MQINIFNKYRRLPLEKRKIVRLVKNILKAEKYKLNTVNIIITNDAYLKELNKRFLKRNRTTNVISFNLDEISEIYVAREKAASNNELYYCIIHGLLHIVGYDHRNNKENVLMDKRCLYYLSHC